MSLARWHAAALLAPILAGLLGAILLLAGPPSALAQAVGQTPPEPEESWVEPPAPGAPSAPSDAAPAGVDRRLQARAEALYAFLEGKRVNLYALYTSETFRDFFTTEEALENYVAYLTNALAKRRFRKYRIDRTEFVSLTPQDQDTALAEVTLIGRHVHVIFFWDVTETVENTWKRIDGEWFVFPPPF